jgi:hypothetical protein
MAQKITNPRREQKGTYKMTIQRNRLLSVVILSMPVSFLVGSVKA